MTRSNSARQQKTTNHSARRTQDAPANDTQSVTQADDAVFLSVDEAAELLRVGRNTLYESIARGEVPGVMRLGRVIRIRRAALLAAS